eukprot:3013407-Pleurochrysis_carterae.AAC.1
MYCFAKALSVVKSDRALVAVVGTFDEVGGYSSDKVRASEAKLDKLRTSNEFHDALYVWVSVTHAFGV